VSVWATKSPRPFSSVRVGPAVAVAPACPGWASFDVPRSSRADDTWKRAVARAVSEATELPAGPVALEVGFVDGGAPNWPALWKASIDGLEAVLGQSQAQPSWNPQDGRIVRLGMHRATRPDFAREVGATIWARPAPLEWDENLWLRDLPERDRAAFFDQHLARVARAQRSAGRTALPGMAREPRACKQRVDVVGVVVFADDDAAYERWLAANPPGFVVNVLGTLGAGAKLHRATCGTISGTPVRGVTWTSAQYVKACARDPGALAQWLEANGARPASACGSCLPEGAP
jgi:hypothetical protein